MKRHLPLGFAVLVTVSMLAACGSDDKDTVANVQDANTKYCQNLSAYGDALSALGALDPTTATKADYEAAAGAVKSARTDLAASGADLVQAEVANLETQAEDLDGALKDASDDAVVADILTAAQAQVTEVRASVATLNTAVCATPSSTPTT